jgi:hypothetical protein
LRDTGESNIKNKRVQEINLNMNLKQTSNSPQMTQKTSSSTVPIIHHNYISNVTEKILQDLQNLNHPETTKPNWHLMKNCAVFTRLSNDKLLNTINIILLNKYPIKYMIPQKAIYEVHMKEHIKLTTGVRSYTDSASEKQENANITPDNTNSFLNQHRKMDVEMKMPSILKNCESTITSYPEEINLITSIKTQVPIFSTIQRNPEGVNLMNIIKKHVPIETYFRIREDDELIHSISSKSLPEIKKQQKAKTCKTGDVPEKFLRLLLQINNLEKKQEEFLKNKKEKKSPFSPKFSQNSKKIMEAKKRKTESKLKVYNRFAVSKRSIIKAHSKFYFADFTSFAVVNFKRKDSNKSILRNNPQNWEILDQQKRTLSVINQKLLVNSRITKIYSKIFPVEKTKIKIRDLNKENYLYNSNEKLNYNQYILKKSINQNIQQKFVKFKLNNFNEMFENILNNCELLIEFGRNLAFRRTSKRSLYYLQFTF